MKKASELLGNIEKEVQRATEDGINWPLVSTRELRQIRDVLRRLTRPLPGCSRGSPAPDRPAQRHYWEWEEGGEGDEVVRCLYCDRVARLVLLDEEEQ